MTEITSRFEWGGFIVSSFIELEVDSALAKYAREHPNFGRQYMAQHPVVVDRFRRELSNPTFTIMKVDDEIVEEASEMLKQHPEYALHAGDAVHLVTALRARAELAAHEMLVFVTADRGLELAARAEGFHTLNPMREGIHELRELITATPAGGANDESA